MIRTISIIFFIYVGYYTFGQVNAGVDVTMSQGLPLQLEGTYTGYVGNPVTAGDDYFVGPFDIGFDFTFYGEVHNQFAICPNGLVSFDIPDIIGSSHQEEAPIPNNIFPKTIMGPYQDLFKRPTAPHSNYIYYLTVGESPNRKLIVGWCEAPMFDCDTKKATYQIVLYEGDNSIVNHILAKPECQHLGNKGTHGLNRDKDVGVAVPGRNNTSWTTSNESWLFEPDGNDNYIISEIDFIPEPIIPQGKLDWAWYSGDELISNQKTAIVYPKESTTYRVVITLCNGVRYSDDIYVKVIPIANAIRPTSSVQENREFKVFADPENGITDYKMYIYNRWGQQIFETDDINKGWDGTQNGSPCSMGVYVWIIYYNGSDEQATNKGTVTLVR